MTTIVVAADDFGLCAEINDAICLLHDRRIVRRTSVLSNSSLFEASVDALRLRPALEIALHLNLTDGQPISSATDVPSLLNGCGCFHGGHGDVIARIVTGRMNRREIHREWRAQIAKVRSAGLNIRQLNGHGHLHLLPHLHGVVLDLLREFDIPDVRLVRSLDSPRGVVLNLCSLELMRRLKRSGLRFVCPDRTLGLRHPGAVDRRIRLDDLALGDGAMVELIVHPSKGANDYHSRWGYASAEVMNWLLTDVEQSLQRTSAR